MKAPIVGEYISMWQDRYVYDGLKRLYLDHHEATREDLEKAMRIHCGDDFGGVGNKVDTHINGTDPADWKNWSAPHYICEIKRVVIPTPIISADARLRGFRLVEVK